MVEATETIKASNISRIYDIPKWFMRETKNQAMQHLVKYIKDREGSRTSDIVTWDYFLVCLFISACVIEMASPFVEPSSPNYTIEAFMELNAVVLYEKLQVCADDNSKIVKICDVIYTFKIDELDKQMYVMKQSE